MLQRASSGAGEDGADVNNILQSIGGQEGLSKFLQNLNPQAAQSLLGRSQQTSAPQTTQPANRQVNLREKYASQLEKIRELGVNDDELALDILVQCNGNVETAANVLMNSGSL